MNRPTVSFKVLFRELKRRNVPRACILYLLACWGGLQLGEMASSALEVDIAVVSRTLLAVAIMGLPVAAIFSWFYKISASGITRMPPFVERRFLDNITPLEDRRNESSSHGNLTWDEADYDWVLEFETGPLLGQRFGVEGSILIGRAKECDITVTMSQISRRHARFVLDAGHLLLEDLGSVNGTSVNGGKVDTAAHLNHQDTVEILDMVIKVKKNLDRSYSGDTTVVSGTFLKNATETRKI